MFNPHCICCHDKDKARMRYWDAQRINSKMGQLEAYAKHKGYTLEATSTPRMRESQSRDLCRTHIRFMCGHCHEAESDMRAMHNMEEKLSSSVFCMHCLLTSIHDSDKESYSHIKHELTNLLRGHYPNAARLIMDT